MADQLSSITGLLDLYTKLGSLGSSKGQSLTETTTVDPTAISSAVNAILSSANGVASVAGAGKSAGLYSSSTQKQLMQNLLSSAAAKAASGNTTTTKTLSSGGSSASANKNLLGLMLLSQAANSKVGKNLSKSLTEGDGSGNLLDSALSGISNLFSSNTVGDGGLLSSSNVVSGTSDATAYADMLQNISDATGLNFSPWSFGADIATDAATSAAADATAETAADSGATDAVVSGISDWWNNLSFACGGRVPKGYATGGRVDSTDGTDIFSDPVALLPVIQALGKYQASRTGVNTASVGTAAETGGTEGQNVDGQYPGTEVPGGILGQLTNALRGGFDLTHEEAANLVAGGAKTAGKAAMATLPTGQILGALDLTGKTSGVLGSLGIGVGKNSFLGWALEAMGLDANSLEEAGRAAAYAHGLESRANAGMAPPDFTPQMLQDLYEQENGRDYSGKSKDQQTEDITGQGRAIGETADQLGYSALTGVGEAISALASAMEGSSSGFDSGTDGSSAAAGGVSGFADSYSDAVGAATDGYAGGGRVRGDNNPGVDDVRAVLRSPAGNKPLALDGGEFVLTAKTTELLDRTLGPQFLENLNKLGKMQGA